MALSFIDRWFHWPRPNGTGNRPAVRGELSATTDAEVQFGLAQHLGDGDVSDQEQAVQWYRKAAEQGHCAAQFHLAQMHAQGKGGVRDEAAAVLWLRRAAEAGHGGAQYHLGVRLYRAGKCKTGGEASELRVDSLRWLHQAVAQSWRGAESAREFVLLGMTKQEAEEGEHRAQSSMANPAVSTAASPDLEPLQAPQHSFIEPRARAIPASGPKGVIVPHQPRPLQRAVGWAVFLLERFVTASLRCRWRDSSGLAEAPASQPVIFCLWHNRLAVSMIVHRRHPRRLAALVSASKDGALLAAVLQTFGVESVRGSSSRRGPQALLELASRAERGYDLALTPDGPKGPRYVAQDGVIALAQLTGMPIIPVTCNTRWKISLKSWDRFQIPLPFSSCEIILNQPILVSRDADESKREELRIALESSLCANSTD